MKKALSVLLVAAALFGFYGSAVNLNDILACKDYWEEAGEKSTADMNKLEDGLNQLKDNEQAYLDGKDQLAEGEKALADGEAQYAEGLKSYQEAPAQLAAGEKKLAEGEDGYKNLKKLIKGLNTAKKHGVSKTKDHDTYWHDAYSNALVPGQKLIVKTLKEKSDMVGMLEMLTGASGLVDKADKAKAVEDFDVVVTKELKPTFEAAAKALLGFADLARGKAGTLDNAVAAYDGLTTLESKWAQVSGGIKMASQGQLDLGDTATAKTEEAAVGFINDNKKALAANEQTKALVGFADLKDAFAGMSKSDYYAYVPATTLLLGGVGQQMSEFLDSKEGQMLQGIAAKGDATKAQNDDASITDKVAGIVAGMQALAGLTGQGAADGPTFKGYAPAVSGGLTEAAGLLEEYSQTAQDSADQFQQWDDGYQTLAHAKDGKVSDEYPDDLASKSSGIPYAFKNIVTNPTTKAAVKKYDKKLMRTLKKYSGDTLKNDTMAEFDEDIVYLSTKVIPRAQKVLAKVKANAAKQLANGRQQLAEGRRSYAEAPAKLADAERQLADGRQQLEDGKAQLAQYEDGEQQVRDGLASLTGTEPDLELESIADRLGGDVDFDNGDDHLDLDEGLNAVEVGRGYQADDGVLITEEIMGRAIGTGALLGAGALAVIAAILSFLKKNKGAGVFAILAAAAGAFGAYTGTNAGTYFSDIAGSTAGSAAWVAAGILGAVALVHAIVHFAAKKAA